MGVLDRVSAGLTAQAIRFAAVGSTATVTQLGLYYFLSGSVGSQLANVISWLIATVLANAAHQRYTFGVTGRTGESDQLIGLLTSLAGLGVSSAVLALLAQPTGAAGTVALIAVNAGVGALRFAALRWWFTDQRAPGWGRGHVRNQSLRSMVVSSPPMISTRRTATALSSSTQ
jgi:putative flippase GtrA